MVKKIKVVEMNSSNVEEPNAQATGQEAVAEPTPMQVEEPPVVQAQEPPAIPESVFEEPKARKPRQQKLVREPRQPKKKQPEPNESDGDSIDTNEMIAVIQNHRQNKKGKQPVATPPTAQEEEIKWVADPSGLKLIPEPPPAPVAKEEEKATCPDCNKVMSAKSLRYAHAKNCKAKQPVKQTPIKMVESVEPTSQVEHPIAVLLAAERAMRYGAKKERIQTLISNAF